MRPELKKDTFGELERCTRVLAEVKRNTRFLSVTVQSDPHPEDTIARHLTPVVIYHITCTLCDDVCFERQLCQ